MAEGAAVADGVGDAVTVTVVVAVTVVGVGDAVRVTTTVAVMEGVATSVALGVSARVAVTFGVGVLTVVGAGPVAVAADSVAVAVGVVSSVGEAEAGDALGCGGVSDGVVGGGVNLRVAVAVGASVGVSSDGFTARVVVVTPGEAVPLSSPGPVAFADSERRGDAKAIMSVSENRTSLRAMGLSDVKGLIAVRIILPVELPVPESLNDLVLR